MQLGIKPHKAGTLYKSEHYVATKNHARNTWTIHLAELWIEYDNIPRFGQEETFSNVISEIPEEEILDFMQALEEYKQKGQN